MSDVERVSLQLKYRPAVFGDVMGQRPRMALLYRMCKLGTPPRAMLFFGERGCGKTTMARIVAKALNCEAGPGPAGKWPCNSCASCVAVNNDTNPDVEEVDAASNGTVAQIGAIIERAYYGTAGGGWRVVILDEAHGLSGPAFEKLLKPTEEPPPRTVFILVTTQPLSVPKTIRSRVSPFQFDAMPVGVIKERLDFVCQAEGFDAEPGLLAAIAEAARGGMRDALVLLDQVASAGITSLSMWRELTGESDFAPVLLAAAADGNYAAMYAAMGEALLSCGDPGHVTRELVRCLADLLVLSCGAPVSVQGEALAARKALLSRLGAARVSAAMSVLWDLHARVRIEDRESALTLALAKISERLGAVPAGDAAPIAPGGGVKASFDDIRDILERA